MVEHNNILFCHCPSTLVPLEVVTELLRVIGNVERQNRGIGIVVIPCQGESMLKKLEKKGSVTTVVKEAVI